MAAEMCRQLFDTPKCRRRRRER